MNELSRSPRRDRIGSSHTQTRHVSESGHDAIAKLWQSRTRQTMQSGSASAASWWTEVGFSASREVGTPFLSTYGGLLRKATAARASCYLVLAYYFDLAAFGTSFVGESAAALRARYAGTPSTVGSTAPGDSGGPNETSHTFDKSLFVSRPRRAGPVSFTTNLGRLPQF